jgi:hypothetical protein
MTASKSDLLKAAGRLADAARLIVGGPDLNGFQVAEPTISTLGERCIQLRQVVDEYDQLILSRARRIGGLKHDSCRFEQTNRPWRSSLLARFPL